MPFVSSVVPSLDSTVMVIGESVVCPSVLAVHVAPRSVEYSNAVIVSPPFDPAENVIVSVLSPATCVEIVGSPGTECGFTLCIDDEVPGPTTLTARNANGYVVPLVNPSTTSGERIDAGSRVTHVVPPSVEY